MPAKAGHPVSRLSRADACRRIARWPHEACRPSHRRRRRSTRALGALEIARRHRRQPRGQAGRPVRRVPGTKADGLRFVGAGGRRPARPRSSAEQRRRRRCRPASPFVQVANARRALALAAARFYPRQPATDRRGHRHQRQDLGRRLHPPDLGRARPCRPRASAPSASSRPRREVYGSLTTPDPVALHRTLDELAGEGVTHLAIEASSHGLDQHRLDGVRVAAGGFTNLSARPSRLSPDARGLSRRQAAAVRRDLVAAGRRRGDRCRSRRMPARSSRRRKQRGLRAAHRRRATATASGSLDAAIDGFAQALHARARRHDLSTCGCRWSAPSRSRTRWSPPALRSRPAAMPDAVFAALEALEGRQGPARTRRRSATARRSSSTTRTSPTRWPRRSRRCGPM